MIRLLPFPAAVFLALLWPASAQALQEDPAGKPDAPQEEFPTWSVNGVLSTDFSGLVSDRGSRDTMPSEGVAGEYALGGNLHLSRELRVSVRACVGCHGVEVQSAFGEFDLTEGVTVRAGRLPVPFGAASQRVNPAQKESTSNPLPYLMGMMVRQEEFNMSIVPGPVVDNGAALLGNFWLGESIQLGYEAAVVRGLKGTGIDLDFAASRDFDDNNGEPAGAARLTLTSGPLTLGGSGMVGHHDTEGDLRYTLGGADLHLKLGEINLRVEGVVRDTQFLDPLLSEETSRRLAFSAQVDAPVHDQVRVFALSDGLKVEDVYLSPVGPLNAPAVGSTDDVNTILRTAGGVVYALRPGVLLKGSAEYWNFSDFDDTWVFHFTIVVAF